MRRTIIALGLLLLPIAACSSDEGYSGSSSAPSGGRYSYGSTYGSSTYGATPSGSTGYGSAPSGSAATAPAQQQALSGATGMSSAAGMASLSAAEQAFMMNAAQGGMAEVELGRLAEQRASSAQVRDFGRMMVQQHGQANQELMGIAQRLGVPLPASLPPSAQAVEARLQQVQGQEFDRQYIEQQAAAHLETRTLFQFAADHAQNAELRGFAQRTLPVIERHIDQLRTISPIAMRTGS